MVICKVLILILIIQHISGLRTVWTEGKKKKEKRKENTNKKEATTNKKSDLEA